MYHGMIESGEIRTCAEFLNMPVEIFVKKYLVWDDIRQQYTTIHKPCDFLEADGGCKLRECRPENCKSFPYTNKPERLASLYSILDAVETCPVAFEIYERLKQIYKFKR